LPGHKHSPFRGRWLWATIGVVLLCALFLTLGIWQLQRLGQKRAANAQILARMQEPPLVMLGQALDPAQDDLRRATVRGTYDYSQEIVLRNRTHNEIPGVHVIVPLRIPGSDAAVLVDRGWIPYEMAGQEQRKVFQDATGEVEVRGILRRTEVRSSRISPADRPLGPERPRLDAWHRVDIPRIQEQVPYPLLPLFLEEDQAPGESIRRFPRAAPEIALSEGGHLGYAVQWFAFAGILLGGYTLLFRQRTQGNQGTNPLSERT
jgi:surfeit locus 1 family protein